MSVKKAKKIHCLIFFIDKRKLQCRSFIQNVPNVHNGNMLHCRYCLGLHRYEWEMHICMYVWIYVSTFLNEWITCVCLCVPPCFSMAKLCKNCSFIYFQFRLSFYLSWNKELFFILIPIQNQMMLTSWMAVQEINATKYYQGLNVIEKCSFHFCWVYVFDVWFLYQISWPSYRIMNGSESVATYCDYTENRLK